MSERPRTVTAERWRVGGKVPLNVYECDAPMFQCHTPEDAERVVHMLNAHESRHEVEPCGHAKHFLIGDEWGHFTCTVCQRDSSEQTIREQCVQIAEEHDKREGLHDDWHHACREIAAAISRVVVGALRAKREGVCPTCDELRSQVAIGDANMLTVQAYAARLEAELAQARKGGLTEADKECVEEYRQFRKMRRSLENVSMLARREKRKGDAEAWEHILRFCEEAGIKPNILRAAPENDEASNAQVPAGQPKSWILQQTQLERDNYASQLTLVTKWRGEERELSDQLAAALKEKRCTCNSTGLQHKPGYTHYETDAGEECPAYHYGPCPRCESARAALAQHALLRATPAHNSGTDPA